MPIKERYFSINTFLDDVLKSGTMIVIKESNAVVRNDRLSGDDCLAFLKNTFLIMQQ